MNVSNSPSNAEESLIMAGRPRIPLLLGQSTFIERAYTTLGLSQAKIAQETKVSIPRVRRHLIEQGIYSPRSPVRSRVRTTALSAAVEDYVKGVKVIELCLEHDVNPSELYRELKLLEIPLRLKDHLKRGHL